MNKIIGTGISGLVGSRIQNLLEQYYSFEDLSLATGIDITDSEKVKARIGASSASTILHMAAKTDVDGCEEDKIFAEEGVAWRVNVEGTHNIVDAAKGSGKKIISISTDFVFNGTKACYSEDDPPDPVNWYGYTKYLGENIIRESGLDWAILRIAYPYRSHYPEKLDFVRKIIDRFTKKEKVTALTDHVFTPTFIDDLAVAIDEIIRQNAKGIYHAVGSENLTPLQATEKIMQEFHLEGEIEKTTRDVFFRGRAFRPCRLALKNDKITKLGVTMLGFSKGLEELKKQTSLA